MGKLALLFIALPLAELLTLVRLGHAIGGLPTLLLVLGSGLLGGLIARAEGLRVLAQMRQAFSTGTMPSHDVLHGGLMLCAAALLIVPGVITDVLALLLLIPWSRRLIAARLLSSVERAIEEGKLRVVHQARSRAEWSRPGPSPVIDTEGETVMESEAAKPPRLNS
jgi:UPF0716 protein FxsA